MLTSFESACGGIVMLFYHLNHINHGKHRKHGSRYDVYRNDVIRPFVDGQVEQIPSYCELYWGGTISRSIFSDYGRLLCF